MIDLKKSKVKYLPMANIESKLRALGKNITVTKGEFEFPAHATQKDIDWNHMDQLHRVYVHNTYQESIRLAIAEDFAVSVAKLKVLGFPVFVDVTDILLGPGRFYQSYTLFGLIYVQNLIEHTNFSDKPNKVTAKWHIASHWLLKPFQKILSYKFEKFHYRLNCEDITIRERRNYIRDLGYSTMYETPNFLNANALTDNLIPPLVKGPEVSFEVNSLSRGDRKTVQVGPLSFLVEKVTDDQIYVWPEACPHEGASLAIGKKCSNNEIQCPWHGLKFRATVLNVDEPSKQIYGMKLKYSAGAVVIASAID
jgi:nitrite reductase/ring-hydroxylating ferredoxin subunit